MMKRQVFNLGGHEGIARALMARLGATAGELSVRHFPDGESYVRVLSDVQGSIAIILCPLDHPDDKFLTLAFLSRVLREQGAVSVGLVAPYLAYMRQDKRFHEGEALTCRHFADLVAEHFDWLATVDPHLHRYHAMGEVYRIPTRVVHATPVIAAWCRGLGNAFLVGPDAESEQWVSSIAAVAGLPYVIGEKTRHGDREVEIVFPDTAALAGKIPLLVDDVVSSGMTLRVTLESLARRGFREARIACVHALFAEGSDRMLAEAGAVGIVSVNTILHASNCLDVGPLLAGAVAELVG